MGVDDKFKELVETCTMECLHDGHRKQVADAALDIAALLKTGNNTLGDVIDTLNPYLVHDDERVRQRGTRALADIVTQALILKETMDLNARQVLTTFFLERVEDTFSFSDTIRGAAVILRSSEESGSDPHTLLNSDKEAALATLKNVMRNAGTVSMSMAARQDVLYVVTNLYDICQPSGADAALLALALRVLFVGERDPSLLKGSFMLLARLLRRTGAEALEKCGEQLFDAYSAYFPILFVPRGSLVTKDELVVSLRMCFAATPYLAFFAIPFLLDKTSSSIASAQADAFATLASCVRSFGASICGPDFPTKALETLRANAFGQDFPALLDSVGILVSAVVATYPQDIGDKFFRAFFDIAATVVLPPKEMEKDEEFDEETSNTGRKILAKLFRSEGCFKKEGGDPASFVTIVHDKLNTIPEAHKKFRYLIIAVLADMAEELTNVPTGTSGIKECAEALNTIFVQHMVDPTESADVFQHAGRGCSFLAGLPNNTMPESTVEKDVETLITVGCSTDRSDAIRSNAFSILTELASKRPDLVAGHIKKCLEQEGVEDNTVVLKGVEGVAKCGNKLFRPIFEALTKLVLSGPNPETHQTLLEAWENVSTFCDASAKESWEIADQTIRGIATYKHDRNIATTDAFRHVIRALMEMAPEDAQKELFDWMCKQTDGAFTDSAMFFAAVSSLKKSVAESKMPEIMETLVKKRTSFASGCTDDSAETACAIAISSLFNKTSGDKWKKERTEALDLAIAHHDSVLLCWMCRAALMNAEDGDSAQKAMDALISLAAESVDAGKCFAVVCAKECPIPEGLKTEAGATSTDGYHERMFGLAFDKLMARYEADQLNHGLLVALANVLSTAPAAKVEEHKTKCVSIAMRSITALKPEDDGMPTLLMLGSLLKSAPQLFVRDEKGEIALDKFGALLNRLCRIATTQKDGHCRAQALELLLLIRRNFAECHTLPFQKHIVALLTDGIDDPKRPVRMLAVRCRNAWMVFLPPE